MKVALLAGMREPRVQRRELHGSMAAVAPLASNIELIELDRAACCGAGVIAEHNQELADTLNARTFALGPSRTDGELMMNICSNLCQGAQVGVSGSGFDAKHGVPRAGHTRTLAEEGLRYDKGPNEQELPVAAWLKRSDSGRSTREGKAPH